MLLWEALSVSTEQAPAKPTTGQSFQACAVRLPYDKRCAALTKSGTRCRGRIRNGSDFCVFHDPELAARRRRRPSATGQRRRRLTHLPDGYLRKLTGTAAVGEAMDRLYREVRLGAITTEMGEVLFNILTRMLDSGLVATGPCPERTRAARLRPKLSELLTRGERAAWRKAVNNAMTSSLPEDPKGYQTAPAARARVSHPKPAAATEKPAKLRLQAAS
jgi:hypothetical protein